MQQQQQQAHHVLHWPFRIFVLQSDRERHTNDGLTKPGKLRSIYCERCVSTWNRMEESEEVEKKTRGETICKKAIIEMEMKGLQ